MKTYKSLSPFLPDRVLNQISDPAIQAMGERLLKGERLAPDDGLACFNTTDLIGLGQLASAVKQSRYGDKAFFISNHHLNYTNVCENRCRFCAFHRAPDSKDAYTYAPEEAAALIAQSPVADLREIHIVGGCHPHLDFDYYTKLLKALIRAKPELKLKAFTAVEIDHLASREGITSRECLKRLKSAGLSAMPGGGAEVFSERVREALFPRKISADRWLEIHGEAHSLGIGTNATLLFGHMETLEERVVHLFRLRKQQDLTGGFRAFIALPFHPENTPLAHMPGPTGVDILKTIAAARLILDNIDHIKAYWVMLGIKLTQTALHFGADDLEGTIVKERIAHQAGAATAPGLTRKRLVEMIREAGLIPEQRDTFHQPIHKS
ncbi:MAG: aminofutalosine synthase MqnE [Desulfobacteraceae bacterium 4572_87]|nr:MAG: aminofutalosine synthase MqnE [Desulfobacteraceae bacterium 4572_87]